MLCGKIAAGQSTLAGRLAARPAAVLIAEDVRNAMGPHVVALLKAGLSVELDFQANTLASRAWMRRIFEAAGAAHELHFLDISDETCKQRLRERNFGGGHPYRVGEGEYELFPSYFFAPAPEEGFNVVVHGE